MQPELEMSCQVVGAVKMPVGNEDTSFGNQIDGCIESNIGKDRRDSFGDLFFMFIGMVPPISILKGHVGIIELLLDPSILIFIRLHNFDVLTHLNEHIVAGSL